MPTCLLGLGSNLGDRVATLRTALAEITALPDVQVVRHSEWHRSQPIGGPPGQGDFLNAAAVIETTVAPLSLLNELGKIENRHGRQQAERWAPRTLDIDLLLYGNEVLESEMLTLPHPRMSFRRFVLAPAAEVAPRMLHPIIGWPIERLLLHLSFATNQTALLSPSADLRGHFAGVLVERCGAQLIDHPIFATAEHHWPAAWTTWLEFKSSPTINEPAPATPPALPYAAAAFPKLTILLDAALAKPGDKLQWSSTVRQPGRGPTLRVQSANSSEIEAEVNAAVAAVWPDLGPRIANRLES